MLIVLSLGSVQTAARLSEAEAIELAKRTLVRDVDATLPRTALATWLKSLFGSSVETTWEVNDCGEQTGNPDIDRGRDFPLCVQAHLALRSKSELYLLLAVGTFKKGLTPGPPRFFYGCVTQGGVPTTWLKKLSEVPAIARAEKGARVGAADRPGTTSVEARAASAGRASTAG